MSFRLAVQQFDEIITLNGGDVAFAQSDPEKFNLYAGLLNLARGPQQLQDEVTALRQRLRKNA